MRETKNKITGLLQRYYSLDKDLDISGENKEGFIKFLYDKRNAALGDSLVNFVYSCTKSIARQEITGLKISDTILLNGFHTSDLSKWLKLKGNRKEKANAIEALILYMWLVFDFSLEEMVFNLMLKLDKVSFSSKVEEQRNVSIAFTYLFDSFDKLLLGKYN